MALIFTQKCLHCRSLNNDHCLLKERRIKSEARVYHNGTSINKCNDTMSWHLSANSVWIDPWILVISQLPIDRYLMLLASYEIKLIRESRRIHLSSWIQLILKNSLCIVLLTFHGKLWCLFTENNLLCIGKHYTWIPYSLFMHRSTLSMYTYSHFSCKATISTDNLTLFLHCCSKSTKVYYSWP